MRKFNHGPKLQIKHANKKCNRLETIKRRLNDNSRTQDAGLFQKPNPTDLMMESEDSKRSETSTKRHADKSGAERETAIESRPASLPTRGTGYFTNKIRNSRRNLVAYYIRRIATDRAAKPRSQPGVIIVMKEISMVSNDADLERRIGILYHLKDSAVVTVAASIKHNWPSGLLAIGERP